MCLHHQREHGLTYLGIEITNEVLRSSAANKGKACVVLLDATSAYDVVPLRAIDVALRRLGAPEAFITWVRQTTANQRRVVSIGGVISPEADSFKLGGLRQGDPLSFFLWLAIADMALSHADLHGKNGYVLAEKGQVPDRDYEIRVQRLGYADDMSAIGSNKRDAEQTAQAIVTMLNVLNIRVSAKKCVTLMSRALVCDVEECLVHRNLTSHIGTSR